MKIPSMFGVSLFAATLLVAAAPGQALEDIRMTKEQRQTLDIGSVALEPASRVWSDRFPGKVVIPPPQERMAGAPSGGVVDELKVAVGDSVERGKTLARLKSPDIVAAQSAYLQAAAEEKIAKADLERDEQLAKDGIISERRLLTTRGQYDGVRVAREQTRQALAMQGFDDSAIAKLEETRELVPYVYVSAPLSGVILEQKAVVGARVERMDPIYRLASLSPLWVEAKVPLERIGGLIVGAEAQVPAVGSVGKVLMVGRDVDSVSQTVLVRAEVKSADKLRPGQFVEVKFAIGDGASRFSVPAGAVVRNGAKAFVFVETSTGFQPVEVELIAMQGGKAVIAGALQGDAKVCARGVAAVKGAWLGLGGGEN